MKKSSYPFQDDAYLHFDWFSGDRTQAINAEEFKHV